MASGARSAPLGQVTAPSFDVRKGEHGGIAQRLERCAAYPRVIQPLPHIDIALRPIQKHHPQHMVASWPNRGYPPGGTRRGRRDYVKEAMRFGVCNRVHSFRVHPRVRARCSVSPFQHVTGSLGGHGTPCDDLGELAIRCPERKQRPDQQVEGYRGVSGFHLCHT